VEVETERAGIHVKNSLIAIAILLLLVVAALALRAHGQSQSTWADPFANGIPPYQIPTPDVPYNLYKQVYQGCEIFTVYSDGRVAIALGRGCK
jgi:hypothetical protein